MSNPTNPNDHEIEEFLKNFNKILSKPQRNFLSFSKRKGKFNVDAFFTGSQFVKYKQI